MRNILASRATALLVALAIDATLPELPNQLHPVVAIGKLIKHGEQLAPPAGDKARLVWGALWVGGSAGVCAALAALVPPNAVMQGAVASTLLAYQSLDRAVGKVEAALLADDLPEARRLLGWHLVSRPTTELSAEEVAGAAIESLAENLADSVIAPSLALLVGGLPGLAAYRLSNTADAMWGYHTPRYEFLGKPAARLDDLLNLAPSRVTALLLALASQIAYGRGEAAWRIARRDHACTASPNAGWPMAAIAGALDTTLTKRDHYTLGNGLRRPDAQMVGEARVIARAAWLLLLGLLALMATAQKKRP